MINFALHPGPSPKERGEDSPLLWGGAGVELREYYWINFFVFIKKLDFDMLKYYPGVY